MNRGILQPLNIDTLIMSIYGRGESAFSVSTEEYAERKCKKSCPYVHVVRKSDVML